MKKRAHLFWIAPLLLAIAIFTFAAFQKSAAPICGDGICQKTELSANSCPLDCSCATGSTGGASQCSTGWNSVYTKLTASGVIQTNWLSSNSIEDYTDPALQAIATTLKRDTPKDTVKATAQWVFQNIKYNESNKYKDCYGKSATDILSRGNGVC